MKIKAAVLSGPGKKLAITELDLAEPRDQEVLVKISACGVCHTDLWVQDYSRHYPIVLGHETSGIIEKTGKGVTGLQPGDPVVLSYTYCGECEACRSGRTYECEHLYDFFEGLRLDGTSPRSLRGKPVAALIGQGGFAAYTVCHKNTVVKVDGGFDLQLLGPLGCGVLTGAGSVLNCLKPAKKKAIAIGGVGCVGLSALMAAKRSGCSPIIAIDRIPGRLEMAKELGATHCINGDETDISAEIKKFCGGVDYAFDTSGNRRLLDALRIRLNPGASACGVGIGGSMNLSRKEKEQGKTWEDTTAGWSVPQKLIPRLLAWHKAGKFPFDRMIKVFPFDEINEAFEANRSGSVIKPVVVIDRGYSSRAR
jgi:aryl-alcohol dehydrogenase